jgi:phage virion morphogenesis protein
MVGVVIEDVGLEEAQAAIGRLIEDATFKEALGELVVNQTKQRIAAEKTAPDGTSWQAWSTAYAGARHGGHSLLMSGGTLLDSISAYVSGDTIEVGSGMVSAATHQFGSRDGRIPARPYLGVSEDNRQEIEDVALDHFAELLR